MSKLNIKNLSNENNDGAPNVSGISTFSSTAYFVPPKGNTSQRPENPEPGSLRFNTDTTSLEYFRGDEIGWEQVEMTSPDLNGGARAVVAIGQANSPVGYNNILEYFTIPTLGNTTDFGDATVTRDKLGAGASRTRGIFVGGEGGGNVIEYVTISSTGNAQDFGDIDQAAEHRFIAAASDSTRTFFGGGYTGGSAHDTIEYITTASTGNGVDFGNLLAATNGPSACASSTRGIFAGGDSAAGWGSPINTIQYITIQTTGNSVDFGDLSVARGRLGATSNSTRGLMMGGDNSGDKDEIDYITIATLGNATDFGNLLAVNERIACTASPTRAVGIGGLGPAQYNTIQYVEILTTGNAVDFGDMTYQASGGAACSNAHGGL